jgi:hypothetical protein
MQAMAGFAKCRYRYRSLILLTNKLDQIMAGKISN